MERGGEEKDRMRQGIGGGRMQVRQCRIKYGRSGRQVRREWIGKGLYNNVP